MSSSFSGMTFLLFIIILYAYGHASNTVRLVYVRKRQILQPVFGIWQLLPFHDMWIFICKHFKKIDFINLYIHEYIVILLDNFFIIIVKSKYYIINALVNNMYVILHFLCDKSNIYFINFKNSSKHQRWLIQRQIPLINAD